MKKFISLLFVSIFLISLVSADWTFDNTKSYNADTKTARIENLFGLGKTYAEIQLISPLNVVVPRGYQKVAEFEIRGFADYKDFISEMDFYDLKAKNNKINRVYDLKFKTFKDVLVDDYTYDCITETQKDGMEVRSCEKTKTGSHYEKKETWEKLTPADIKKNENLTIGIFTEVLPYDKVDWIPTFAGVRIPEWATWTEDLNVDLVSYWKLDEQDTTGTGTIIDIVGTNNGTNVGADNTTGKINTAYNFVDTSSDYINLPNKQNFGTHDFSYSFWTSYDTGTDNTNGIIGAYGSTPYTYFRYYSGTLQNVMDFGGGQLYTYSNITLSANTWYHVVGTFDRDGVARLYVNGFETNNSIDISSFSAVDFKNSNRYTIGSIGNNLAGWYWKGKVDEIGVWNRTLTASEVLQLYNGGTGLPYGDVSSTGLNVTLISPINYYNTSYKNIDFTVNVTDNLFVENVTLFINGIANETNNSHVNGTYVFSKIFDEGSYNWSIEAFDNESNNLSSAVRYFTINITNPVFTHIPTNTTVTYIQPTSADFNATDETGSVFFYVNDTTNFQIDSSGLLTNKTVLNVGIYDLNVSINNSFGSSNYTIYRVTVSKANTALSITGTSPITYGTTTNVAGSNCPSQLTCSLDKSNAVYGAGTQTFNYSTSGNANYTANWTTISITINKATPTGTITGTTPIESGTAADITGSESNSGDADVIYTLYRNGNEVTNPDTTDLTDGTYNYIYNSTEGANYTTVASLDTFELTVAPRGSVTWDNIAYYKLDESSGNAIDATGTYNLTRIGTITDISPGKINSAKQALQTGTTPNLNRYEGNISGLSAVNNTICSWFKGVGDYGTFTIFNNAEPALSQAGMRLIYSNNNLRADVNDAGLSSGSQYSFTWDNDWHFICGSWDNSTKKVSLYLDGILVNNTGGWDGRSLKESVNVTLFSDLGGTNGNATIILDEIGIWGRALSESEISALYNGGNGLSYLTGDLLKIEYNNTNITLSCSYPYQIGIQDYNYNYNYNGGNINFNYSCNGTNYTYQISAINGVNSANVYFIYENGTVLSEEVEWIYKVFENSRNVNSTAYETEYQTYTINVTANSSLTGVSLLYNGTAYTMTNQGSGIWSYSRDLPTSTVGNNSVSYRFTYAGSTINSDYTTYQNVLPIQFGLCNGTLTDDFLNISFKDESDLSTMNASIQSSTWEYYLGTGTQTKTYLFSNISENPTYIFCATPTNKTLYTDVQANYLSTSYPTRIWQPDTLTLTNSSTNKILYLLSQDDGIYVTFATLTDLNTPITEVDVIATRSISGEDVIVSQGTSDSAGSVTFWLNPNYDHTVTASKTGYGTGTITIRPTQSTYTIYLSSSTNYTYISNVEGLLWGIFPRVGILNLTTTQNYGFNVSSIYGNILKCKFEILNQNKTEILASGETIATNQSYCSAQVSYNPSGEGVPRFKGRLLVDIGDGYVIIEEDAYWAVEDIDTTGMTFTDWFRGIKNLDLKYFNNNENHREYTNILLFFLIITIICGILNYAGWDIQTNGGIIFVVGFLIWIASAVGFLNLSGISPIELLNKHFIAVIYTMFMTGFYLRNM